MGSRVETLPQRPTWLGSSHQWPWWHSSLQLLSSRGTPAMPSSCRSRDLTLVLESLEQHTHRRFQLQLPVSAGLMNLQPPTLTPVCFATNVQSTFYLFSFGLISTYSIKH